MGTSWVGNDDVDGVPIRAVPKPRGHPTRLGDPDGHGGQEGLPGVLHSQTQAEILHARLLEKGLNPVLRLNPTAVMETDFYQISNRRQLEFIAPGEEQLCRALNGSIFLHAPESVTHLSRADPRKIGRAALARKFMRDILDRRDEQGKFGWTLCVLPTPALAEHAGLSVEA